MAASADLVARLGLRLGERLAWSAGGRHFTTTLVAIYRPAPHRLIARILLGSKPLAILRGE